MSYDDRIFRNHAAELRAAEQRAAVQASLVKQVVDGWGLPPEAREDIVRWIAEDPDIDGWISGTCGRAT